MLLLFDIIHNKNYSTGLQKVVRSYGATKEQQFGAVLRASFKKRLSKQPL